VLRIFRMLRRLTAALRPSRSPHLNAVYRFEVLDARRPEEQAARFKGGVVAGHGGARAAGARGPGPLGGSVRAANTPADAMRDQAHSNCNCGSSINLI
jgi:hypothetical protein